MTTIIPDIAAMGGGMHTAGIYSDMTVDGPEIGTLVMVVDRAKNLPNRKTIGKQNPYCAARLGKDAKRTDTDVRGGQTPKWDQELRFTVHDSPDYLNIKVSVFNDDKKTDLIGEMWVDLTQVIAPGGGKMDDWHQLTCKGKYAGEVMLELTYYDSRPDARGEREKIRERSSMDRKIKRRPLPTDLHTTPLPHQMENTRTAGPRAMGSGPRMASSMSSSMSTAQFNPASSTYSPQFNPSASTRSSAFSPSSSMTAAPPVQYPTGPYYAPTHEEQEYHPGYHHSSMPELPDIPPLQYQHGPPPPLSHPNSYHGRSQSFPELPHSHSAPSSIPQVHNSHAGTPRRSYVSPSLQPTVEDEMEYLPPLPPSHHSRGPPPRSHSVENYSPQPLAGSHSTPDFRNSYSGRPSQPPTQPNQPRPHSSHRVPARHSMTGLYNTATPPRAHPLASEMRRSVSPAPYSPEEAYHQVYAPENAPMIRPRAISPTPPAPPPQQPRKSLASIRHPIQTFAAQAAAATNKAPSPLSIVPPRKSVSPRPGTSESGGVPFSPDDYSSFNPNASVSSRHSQSYSTNPHSPYHIPSPRGASEEPELNRPLPNPDGPITTWDGRTVDPSDHLPVHSWAPEPIQKTPEKLYGQGNYDPNRPRGISGPRHNVNPTPPGRRDMVVNVRSKGSPNPNSYDPQSSGHAGRTRLVRRNDVPASPNPNSPLSEIDMNPYAAGQRYQNSYAGGSPNPMHRSRSPAPHPQYQQQQGQHYGDIFGGNYENTASHYAESEYDQWGGRGGRGGGGGRAYSEPPPNVPAKIPFDHHAYGTSALEREMSRIDIGGSGGGRGTVSRRSGYGR